MAEVLGLLELADPVGDAEGLVEVLGEVLDAGDFVALVEGEGLALGLGVPPVPDGAALPDGLAVALGAVVTRIGRLPLSRPNESAYRPVLNAAVTASLDWIRQSLVTPAAETA